MTLNDLVTLFQSLVTSNGLISEISMRSFSVSTGERVSFERRLHNEIRYIEFQELNERGGTWEFLIQFGSYKSENLAQDFDGKRGGPATYALDFAVAWLLDLTPAKLLPMPPLP
jgi:hypothetical protein